MYTTKAKIENYLMIEIDSSFSTQIDQWIAGVKAYIDTYTGKVFEEATSQTKYYDGNGRREIMIDDCLSIDTLDILDNEGNSESSLTEGDGNDFLLYPLNETPKTSIVLTPVADIGVIPKGRKRVKVVGTFGHSSTVPSDIELVATKLVGAIIQKGLRGGEIKSESLGDYSVSFIEEVAEELKIADILQPYVIYKL